MGLLDEPIFLSATHRDEYFFYEMQKYAEDLIKKGQALLEEEKTKGLLIPKDATILSRIKSLDSCFEKIEIERAKGKAEYDVRDVNDFVGFRIITNNENIEACYEIGSNAMSILMKNPEMLKIEPLSDFIKKPKPSGYRALHYAFNATNAVYNISVNVEIQVMTPSMAIFADETHEEYKVSKNGISK